MVTLASAVSFADDALGDHYAVRLKDGTVLFVYVDDFYSVGYDGSKRPRTLSLDDEHYPDWVMRAVEKHQEELKQYLALHVGVEPGLSREELEEEFADDHLMCAWLEDSDESDGRAVMCVGVMGGATVSVTGFPSTRIVLAPIAEVLLVAKEPQEVSPAL